MEKYVQYTFEDWILDEDFAAFVKGKNPSFEKIIEKVANLAPAQRTNIMNATAFLESIPNIKEPTHALSEDALWNQIDSAIDTEKKVHTLPPTPKEKKLPKRSWWKIAAAASVLMIGLAWFLALDTGNNSFATAKAEHKNYSLPDGSIITLNAMSKIEYDAKKWSTQRELTLSGEAFFSVNKGSTFTVKTDNGQVTVLGTRFNVSTFDGFNVACEEGRVRVSAAGKAVELAANETAQVENNILIKKEANIEHSIAWKKGTFYIDNQTLEQVAQTIERQFNYQVTVDSDLLNRQFTGVISKKQSVTEIFQTVCWPLNLNFEKTNTGFHIFEPK